MSSKISFERAKQCDATVNRMLKCGASLQDIIGVLAAEKERLVGRITELEGIAPKKIALKNGQVMVWHCPDELVPLTPSPG